MAHLNQRKAHVQGAGGGRRLHLRPIPAHPNSASLSNLLQTCHPDHAQGDLSALGPAGALRQGAGKLHMAWLDTSCGALASRSLCNSACCGWARGRACVCGRGRAAAEGPVMVSSLLCLCCATCNTLPWESMDQLGPSAALRRMPSRLTLHSAPTCHKKLPAWPMLCKENRPRSKPWWLSLKSPASFMALCAKSAA